MRTLFMVIIATAWIEFSLPAAIRAAEYESCLDCGITMKSCCFHHPTTLSYHPECYNFRHYYNIVGHDTNYGQTRHGYNVPVDNQPEQILTPMPAPKKSAAQTTDSARLNGAKRKNF